MGGPDRARRSEDWGCENYESRAVDSAPGRLLGGIATDTTARALRLADSEPVPGLFVVGEAAGGIHGAKRLTACSMSDCCVTGMIAGERAAKLQKRTI